MSASSTCSGNRTALVTGASSGIGRAVSALLVEKGLTVFGTSRNPGALPAGQRLPGVTYLPLDVTDAASARACAKATGPVDILVNNAGQSQLGPLEDIDESSVERLFAVNVFGPMRMAREYLPGMRAAGAGSIIMIGSLVADFPVPFQTNYAGTKSAIRGLSAALRLEVAPFGVNVSVVQPGYFRSDINRRRERVVLESSPYATSLADVTRVIDAAHATAGDPRDVAKTIWRAVTDPHPAPVYSVGTNAPVLLLLKRLLPARRVEAGIARRYHLAS
jgi:NAD(P)-dependent dehydrogenase (short-subunit alcohol dehydrogenase family)